MILVSFFSEDNVLSDEIKICYIFEYKNNENRAFRFFGTPGTGREPARRSLRETINKSIASLIIF